MMACYGNAMAYCPKTIDDYVKWLIYLSLLAG